MNVIHCLFYCMHGLMLRCVNAMVNAMDTHSNSFVGVHFNHASEQVLALGGHEVWNVENAPLHFLEQLSQVVVVER